MYTCMYRYCEMIDIYESMSDFTEDENGTISQIEKDINIDVESGRKDKTGKMILIKKYNNSGDVDDLVKQIKKQLEKYREDFIGKKLFKYQLLK